MERPNRAPVRRLLAVLLAIGGAVVAARAADPTPEQRSLWSLRPVRPVSVPATMDVKTSAHPIDAFIDATLAARGIRPVPTADRATLLRRASLDLVGLPPTPEEVAAFESDPAPGAFERVVDRLLASPGHGERWARHWLDLARYAESEGFKADETRPDAWRYRDYVIRSFNADKPYDRFVQEQLAGDELWPDEPDARIATGFNRHYPDESNARDLMQRRQDILNDITDTVGSVFCGMTFACARCHDHKWDPITQADYYRLQAFFANTAADDHIPLLAPDELVRYRGRQARWEEKTRTIREEMAGLEEPHRRAILQDYVEKYPDNIQAALAKPAIERTSFEHQMVAKAKLYLDRESHQYLAPAPACVGRMKKEEKERWQALDRRLQTFAASHPGKLPVATGVADVAPEPPATYVLGRGLRTAPREEVQPGFLSLLDPRPTPVFPAFVAATRDVAAGHVAEAARKPSSGRRSALAKLLTDPQNPLVARVMVNRVWHHHFGRGLVATPSDLGLKGDRPSHPELLDWLAQEFVRSGWSMKHLHRLIVGSAAYQRRSDGDSGAAVDPDDRLLWRYPRSRLEGETVRDAALAVAGRLNPEPGGPSIFPELPPGMETRGGWKTSADLAARDRRSIYVFVRRNTRYPMFETFDMPDTHESCPRRNVTTSPIQALALLNSRLTHEWAQSFAGRVLATAGADEAKQIETAWRLAYGRPPAADEVGASRQFCADQRHIIARRHAASEPVALPSPPLADVDPDHAASLVDLCHALLNSNEFVYRN